MDTFGPFLNSFNRLYPIVLLDISFDDQSVRSNDNLVKIQKELSDALVANNTAKAIEAKVKLEKANAEIKNKKLTYFSSSSADDWKSDEARFGFPRRNEFWRYPPHTFIVKERTSIPVPSNLANTFHLMDKYDAIPMAIWYKLLFLHEYMVGDALLNAGKRNSGKLSFSQLERVYYARYLAKFMDIHGMYHNNTNLVDLPLVNIKMKTASFGQMTAWFCSTFINSVQETYNRIMSQADKDKIGKIHIPRGRTDGAFDKYAEVITSFSSINTIRLSLDRMNETLSKIVYNLTGSDSYMLKQNDVHVELLKKFGKIFEICHRNGYNVNIKYLLDGVSGNDIEDSIKLFNKYVSDVNMHESYALKNAQINIEIANLKNMIERMEIEKAPYSTNVYPLEKKLNTLKDRVKALEEQLTKNNNDADLKASLDAYTTDQNSKIAAFFNTYNQPPAEVLSLLIADVANLTNRIRFHKLINFANFIAVDLTLNQLKHLLNWSNIDLGQENNFFISSPSNLLKKNVVEFLVLVLGGAVSLNLEIEVETDVGYTLDSINWDPPGSKLNFGQALIFSQSYCKPILFQEGGNFFNMVPLSSPIMNCINISKIKTAVKNERKENEVTDATKNTSEDFMTMYRLDNELATLFGIKDHYNNRKRIDLGNTLDAVIYRNICAIFTSDLTKDDEIDKSTLIGTGDEAYKIIQELYSYRTQRLNHTPFNHNKFISEDRYQIFTEIPNLPDNLLIDIFWSPVDTSNLAYSLIHAVSMAEATRILGNYSKYNKCRSVPVDSGKIRSHFATIYGFPKESDTITLGTIISSVNRNIEFNSKVAWSGLIDYRPIMLILTYLIEEAYHNKSLQ